MVSLTEIAGSADPVIAANYKTHATPRWPSMIYEVVELGYVLNACGLVCLARPNKECQFFMSSADNICYLGSFDNTAQATTVVGSVTDTVYINYGKHIYENTVNPRLEVDL